MLTTSSPLWHRIKRYYGLYDRSIFICLAIALFFLLVHISLMVAFLLPRWGRLDFLRLHYTASLGIDWIGEWWNLLWYPGFGVGIFFINGYFSGRLALHHRLLGLVIAILTMLLECMVMVAGIMAILLNR